MPPVSAAEKSMTTQHFHLRKPMMEWLATQVCMCVRVCKFMNVYVSSLVDIRTSSSSLQCGGITRCFMATARKYAYLSANPHQQQCLSNLRVFISAG